MPVLLVLFLISAEGAREQAAQSAEARAPGTVAAAVDSAPPPSPSSPSTAPTSISSAQPASDPGSLLKAAAGFLASVMAQNYLAAVV